MRAHFKAAVKGTHLQLQYPSNVLNHLWTRPSIRKAKARQIRAHRLRAQALAQHSTDTGQSRYRHPAADVHVAFMATVRKRGALPVSSEAIPTCHRRSIMLESATVADLEHRNCRLWLPKTRNERDEDDDDGHKERATILIARSSPRSGSG